MCANSQKDVDDAFEVMKTMASGFGLDNVELSQADCKTAGEDMAKMYCETASLMVGSEIKVCVCDTVTSVRVNTVLNILRFRSCTRHVYL